MNRRGERESGVFAIILWAAIVVLIAGFVLLYIHDLKFDASILENLPSAVSTVYDTVLAIFSPIANGLYQIVTPSIGTPDTDDNVRMIAFSIFLLLTLIGTKTLRPLIKGPFLAFFISFIIGIIAARSLTSTILKDSALAASPIAAVSLVLGFLPIYALSKNIGKWTDNIFSRMVIYTVAGLVYAFIFSYAFNAISLGVTYGAGIVLLGAADMLRGYAINKWKWAKNIEVGRIMGEMHVDIATAKAIAEGRASALRP